MLNTETTPHLALVRHGQSQANLALTENFDPYFYSTSGSDAELGLTLLGRLQSLESAELLSSWFSSLPGTLSLVSNRYERIQETAAIIASRLPPECKRVIDSRLEKRSYGLFWNLTYRGVAKLFPDEYQLYRKQGPLLYRPPLGENYPDLFKRVDAYYDQLLSEPVGNTIIVTSSVVLLALQRRIEGMSPIEVWRRYESHLVPNGATFIYGRVMGRFRLRFAFTPGAASDKCNPVMIQ